MIVAGIDDNGPSVYSVLSSGMIVKVPYAIAGSGSTYIFGLCDSTFKEHMNKQECLDFAKRAVFHAMNRDGSSGGVIRTLVITNDGIERDMIPGDLVFKTFN